MGRFSQKSDSAEFEFNDPFDQWLRSMKPETPEFAQNKEKFIEGFKVKIQADIEARTNRPWIEKFAFWR